MSSELVGIIGFLVFVVLMLCGIPLAVVFVVAGVAGLFFLLSPLAAVTTLAQLPFSWVTPYSLSCIPMFVLLGMLIAESGIGASLYKAAHAWIGRLPGGMAMTAIIALALFGCISGSAVAAVAALGGLSYQEMKKYKYDPSLSTGAIAVGASMNVMIPPSIPMIIFALVAELSVGKFMMAGFIPGLVEVVVCSLVIFVMVKFKPSLAPVASDDRYTFKEKMLALKDVIPVLVIFAIIFGGLYSGIFTATEAGAFGAAATIVVLLVMKRLTRQHFIDALIRTTMTTGVIFMILIGVAFFNTLIALSGIPQALSEIIISSNMPWQVFLMLILLLYIPLGMIMEEISMILLTVPIYIPIVVAMGQDPLYFGILIIVAWQMAFITPPVALLAFITKSVVKEVPIGTIFKGCIPQVIALAIVALILIFVPDIVMWLPNMMKY